MACTEYCNILLHVLKLQSLSLIAWDMIHVTTKGKEITETKTKEAGIASQKAMLTSKGNEYKETDCTHKNDREH